MVELLFFHQFNLLNAEIFNASSVNKKWSCHRYQGGSSYRHSIKSLDIKMKFSIKDFLSKCNQIRSFLWIWSHLLNKSLMENFIFCEVQGIRYTNQLKLPNIWASVYVSTKTPIFVFPSICRSSRPEEACNFIKKEILTNYVNFVNFLRTPFLQITFGWLLL